ncbi:unnamed protein product [Tilletia controversa]|nr:unnamed protein product [Tilletia controversa]
MHQPNISHHVGADSHASSPIPLEPPRTPPPQQAVPMPMPTTAKGIPSVPESFESPSSEGKEAVMLGVATGLAILGVLMVVILVWIALRIGRTAARASSDRDRHGSLGGTNALFSPSRIILGGRKDGDNNGGGGGGGIVLGGDESDAGFYRDGVHGPGMERPTASRGTHRMEIESDEEVDQLPNRARGILKGPSISPTYSMSSFGPTTLPHPTLPPPFWMGYHGSSAAPSTASGHSGVYLNHLSNQERSSSYVRGLAAVVPQEQHESGHEGLRYTTLGEQTMGNSETRSASSTSDTVICSPVSMKTTTMPWDKSSQYQGYTVTGGGGGGSMADGSSSSSSRPLHKSAPTSPVSPMGTHAFFSDRARPRSPAPLTEETTTTTTAWDGTHHAHALWLGAAPGLADGFTSHGSYGLHPYATPVHWQAPPPSIQGRPASTLGFDGIAAAEHYWGSGGASSRWPPSIVHSRPLSWGGEIEEGQQWHPLAIPRPTAEADVPPTNREDGEQPASVETQEQREHKTQASLKSEEDPDRLDKCE